MKTEFNKGDWICLLDELIVNRGRIYQITSDNTTAGLAKIQHANDVKIVDLHLDGVVLVKRKTA